MWKNNKYPTIMYMLGNTTWVNMACFVQHSKQSSKLKTCFKFGIPKITFVGIWRRQSLFLDLEEKKLLLIIECEELMAKKMQSFMLHREVVVVVVVALLLVCMLQADAASGTRRILEEPKIRFKTENPLGGRNSFANQEFHLKADGGGDEESEEEPGGTNSRPLIGILSQPTCGEKTRESESNWDSASSSSSSSSSSNRSCIAASYVKFVESGGARAVPILYNEPEHSLIQVCLLQISNSFCSEIGFVVVAVWLLQLSEQDIQA